MVGFPGVSESVCSYTILTTS